MSWKKGLNQCGICLKGVYFFQPYLSVQDEYVSAIWHKACARDYDEWAFKMSVKTLKPLVSEYEPDMWKRLEDIQARNI